MLTLDMVLTYVDALYKAEPGDCPHYDEFRDMFSGGQVQSKQWMISQLKDISEVNIGRKKVVVCGAWYGILSFMLEASFSNFDIASLDLDERCRKFIGCIKTYDKFGHRVIAIQENMYDYRYTEDVVINTSGEHIEDLEVWVEKIPTGTVVVLQSSNFNSHPQHINCVSSADELLNKAGLQFKEVIYKGELQLPTYTRFMVIFKK